MSSQPGLRSMLLRRGTLAFAVMAAVATSGLLWLPAGPGNATTMAVTAAQSTAESTSADHVIVVGVPGLRWQQVRVADMPYLAALVARSSLGAMSVRSARSRTCPGDGWVQLGTGNRARVPVAENDPDAEQGLCPAAPEVKQEGHGATVPSWPDIVAENEALHFGAEPGALANSLHEAGACLSAVGPDAPLATASGDGESALWQPSLSGATAAALAVCPVTVVGSDALVDGADPTGLAEVDAVVAAVDKARSKNSLLIVVGVSEVRDEPPSLHVALAQGPGFTSGLLVSSSTRRAPFVQLSDVAPTVLSVLGLPQPAAMTYGPWRAVRQETTATGDERLPDLVERDAQAQQVGRLIPPFFVTLVLTQAALYLLAYFALRRVTSATRRRWVLAGTQVLAVAYAAGPVATFLANLLPWWRTTYPLPTLLVAVSLAGGTVTAIAFLGPWRRHPFGPSGCVAMITAVVLAADVISGANLQLSSLAGYSPIVAGRFAGLGNLAFATFGAGALLGAAALVSDRSRRTTLFTVSVIGVLAVLVDGLPAWGSDFGGVIALVPSFVVLGVTATGSRVSWRQLVSLILLGVVVVAGISTADYLRPEADRTHLGRFVQQLLDGSAGLVVQRKIEANLNLLTNSVLTLLVPLALVFLAFLIRRPRGLLPWTFGQVPTLRAGLTAVLVLGVVGGLVNDSGVAIPVMAATLVIPVAIAVVAASLQRAGVTGDVPDTVAGPAGPGGPPG